VRAMPKSNAPSWRLLFDELGYAPDFVVADAAPGAPQAAKAPGNRIRRGARAGQVPAAARVLAVA
jgi:hypothetical protein